MWIYPTPFHSIPSLSTNSNIAKEKLELFLRKTILKVLMVNKDFKYSKKGRGLCAA